MSTIDSMSPELDAEAVEPASRDRVAAAGADPRQAQPLTWVSEAGSRRLAFLLPLLADLRCLLVVPDRAAGDHVAAAHEPRQPATWVGLQNFSEVIHDPLVPDRRQEHRRVRRARADLRLPDPAGRGRADERGPERRGLYTALAYLPVVIPPVVAVLLWKTFYDAGSTGVFNTILGWVGIGPQPWIQSQTGDAVARARVDLGERRRHGDHLPGRADRREP